MNIVEAVYTRWVEAHKAVFDALDLIYLFIFPSFCQGIGVVSKGVRMTKAQG